MAAQTGKPLPDDTGAAACVGTMMVRDGTLLHWRAIQPDDAERLQAFHKRLSHKSLLFRFFGEMPVLGRELAESLSHVDYTNRMAIVVTPGTGANEPVIAVVRYERADDDSAEMALVVEDSWQGRGIGPQLLRALAIYARGRGFTTFLANVMYDNDHMLAMLRNCGLPSTHQLREGRVEMRLDIAQADEQH